MMQDTQKRSLYHPSNPNIRLSEPTPFKTLKFSPLSWGKGTDGGLRSIERNHPCPDYQEISPQGMRITGSWYRNWQASPLAAIPENMSCPD
ncbi:MAG: hypothetical protein ABJO14_03680 [Haloferula sp.]|uniref:hypothetical protein n=1 Tax=Haloferula sp. TaxID=2497595 RepID=UPI0032A05D12